MTDKDGMFVHFSGKVGWLVCTCFRMIETRSQDIPVVVGAPASCSSHCCTEASF